LYSPGGANVLPTHPPFVHPSPKTKWHLDRRCKTVCPMLSDRCPVCLSVLNVCPVLYVTLVYCGQTAGWIKMKLATVVGLGPRHIMLDGNPALPQRGTAPHFRLMSVVATWYGGRPRPRRRCVSSPPQKAAANVRSMYCGQTVGCIRIPLGSVGTEVDLGPGDVVLDRNPAPSPAKKRAQPPIFGPCLLWPNGWMDPLATDVGPGQSHIV